MARLPKPKVYVVQNDSPNAFATGRNPKHSAVAVTTGIRRILDREELKAVLSHEMGHVRNRDILVSTIVATVAGAVMFLASIARWGLLFGFGGRRDNNGGGAIALVLWLVIIILAPIAALLIRMAISRAREYGADETGPRSPGGRSARSPPSSGEAERSRGRRGRPGPYVCNPAYRRPPWRERCRKGAPGPRCGAGHYDSDREGRGHISRVDRRRQGKGYRQPGCFNESQCRDPRWKSPGVYRDRTVGCYWRRRRCLPLRSG